MSLDVAGVRNDFPALLAGVAYFDGPGGTQVPRQVGEAIASTITGGISNRGTVTAAERRAEEVVVGARQAVADLLGCDPGGVVVGRSMTQVTYDVSRAPGPAVVAAAARCRAASRRGGTCRALLGSLTFAGRQHEVRDKMSLRLPPKDAS